MDTELMHKVYNDLQDQRMRLHYAVEYAITTKRNYENAKADKILSGEIVGKNELEREAKGRELLYTEYRDMLDGEERERMARRDYDIAALEVELANRILRIEEMTQTK